ncbi:hypothetical protein ACIUYK_22345 [Pseudomonas aeruginosa]
MLKISKIIQASLLGTMMTLAGCASEPLITYDQLQDPKDTPKEQWSDALTYLEAMGVHGMRDIPKDLLAEVSHPSAGAYGTGALDVGLVGLGAVSSPSSMGGGAALGVGLGLMLLGGGIPQTVSSIQVAAWVPASLADSPEEAVRVVDNEYNSARKRAFKKGLSKEKMLITKYPQNHTESYGDEIAIEQNLLQFDQPAKVSPSFLEAPMSFGPIFIRRPIFYVDARRNSMEVREAMQALSAELPDWFIIYSPPQYLRKGKTPPVVYRSGEEKRFIGK